MPDDSGTPLAAGATSAGTAIAAIALALSGVVGTGAVDTLGEIDTNFVPISGNAGTGAAGDVSTGGSTAALSGIVGTSAIGTPYILTMDGLPATGSVGSMIAQQEDFVVTLVGIRAIGSVNDIYSPIAALVGSVGTITAGEPIITLTGESASVMQENLTVEGGSAVSLPITGNQIQGYTSIVKSVGPALVGSVGTLTVDLTNLTEVLVGVGAATSLGRVIPITPGLTGYVGTVVVNVNSTSVALTGVPIIAVGSDVGGFDFRNGNPPLFSAPITSTALTGSIAGLGAANSISGEEVTGSVGSAAGKSDVIVLRGVRGRSGLGRILGPGGSAGVVQPPVVTTQLGTDLLMRAINMDIAEDVTTHITTDKIDDEVRASVAIDEKEQIP